MHFEALRGSLVGLNEETKTEFEAAKAGWDKMNGAYDERKAKLEAFKKKARE